MKKIYPDIALLFIFFSFQISLSQSGWLPLTSGTNQNLFCILFTSSDTGYASGSNQTIIKTMNAGSSWIQVHTGGNLDLISMYFTSSLTGYAAGGSFSGIPLMLKTIDGGENWNIITPSINSSLFTVFFTGTGTGFAGAGSGVITKTTDSGNTWNNVNTPGITDNVVSLFFVNTNTGYGVTGGTTQIIKSTDGGNNWVILNTGLTGGFNFWSIKFLNENTGYAIDYNGKIAKTTNGGTDWFEQQSQTINTLRSISLINENTSFICGNNGIILKSTNGGINWNQQISGTANWLMSICFTDEVTGYVAGIGGVIRKTTTGGEPIGIKKISTEIPGYYILKQNFPNPFNPLTFIRFEIPEYGLIELKIYDSAGTEVSVMVNESLSPGIYEVQWDGTNYSSGIYFYKIYTKGFSGTGKMVLIK